MAACEKDARLARAWLLDLLRELCSLRRDAAGLPPAASRRRETAKWERCEELMVRAADVLNVELVH